VFPRSRTLIAAALIAGGAATAAAQPAPAPKTAAPAVIRDPKTFAADFLAQVVRSGAEAYDALKSTSLPGNGIDNLKQAAAQRVAAMGAVQGYELVGEARLGKAVLRLNYLLLHERIPELDSFIFYLPPKASGWQLVSLQSTVEPVGFPFPPPK
jgi:hypothetical protein